MNEQIKIWLVGNTRLRNPNRIQEGFSVFANSAFVGHLHGRENELGFMNLLDEKGIIQNEKGKDSSGSHARKWRLMFAKNGLIYPQIQKKDGRQEDLGTLDNITPFGRSFLKADTYPAIQELPSLDKDIHALSHDICLIFCVILSRCTSSTPPSSALKIKQMSVVRVEKSKRDKIQPLQGT